MLKNICFSKRVFSNRLPAIFSRTIVNLSTNELRQTFLKYFEKNDHLRLPHSSLVPKDDKSIFFTNAGKSFSINITSFLCSFSPHKQVTTIQPCIRTGGKHNDLDNVGKTPRHHTLFEMLGNFSFSSYDKSKAIHLAWNFLTDELQIPANRLRVSVLAEDQNTFDVWKNEIKLSDDQIILNDTNENFWTMGDSEGPCGTCTEIFWNLDRQDISPNHPDQWMELWNIVFMDKWQDADNISNLSSLSIDTGMGLERLASVLQNKQDNFDTDEFQYIITGIKNLINNNSTPTKKFEFNQEKINEHYKIIADHIRSASMLIAQGITPSNTGQGYVLRRIIRRAIRSAYQIGAANGLLCKTFPLVEQSIGKIYSELVDNKTKILQVLQTEETSFFSNLQRGMKILKNNVDKCPRHNLSPEVVFKLYDTYGFPIDLTRIILSENGKSFDIDEVEKLISEAKLRSKTGSNIESPMDPNEHTKLNYYLQSLDNDKVFNTFKGYVEDINIYSPQSCKIISKKLISSNKLALVINPCPFYALGDGQVSDLGILSPHEFSPIFYDVCEVKTTPSKNCTVVIIKPQTLDQFDNGAKNSNHTLPKINDELFEINNNVKCYIDADYRRRISANHTASHILLSALRKIISEKITKQFCFIGPDHFILDFRYKYKLTNSQIDEIQSLVNFWAQRNLEANTHVVHLHKAKNNYGALGNYGENPDPLKLARVVEFKEVNKFPPKDTPPSLLAPILNQKRPKYKNWYRKIIDFQPSVVSSELCDGTHLDSTIGIYPFFILSQSEIGSGLLRLFCAAGQPASDKLIELNDYFHNVANISFNQDKIFTTTSNKYIEKLNAADRINIGELEPFYANLSRESYSEISKEMIKTIKSNVLEKKANGVWIKTASRSIQDAFSSDYFLNKNFFKSVIDEEIVKANQQILFGISNQKQIQYEDIPIKVSIMINNPSPQLIKSWIKSRISHLSSTQPGYIHIVVQDHQICVAVGDELAKLYLGSKLIDKKNVVNKLIELKLVRVKSSGGNVNVVLKTPVDASNDDSIKEFMNSISPLLSSSSPVANNASE
ncbi:hypothetical protein BB561_002300 [Smittium simulii]|uniref:Alanine--tRNA ligase n=1 Tax=Smittium simulii TaxID=133385 RepID=A0A2T9YQU5_9FUNG|nr:hypothetical protein BB561_002300 [Smittium simulii]